MNVKEPGIQEQENQSERVEYESGCFVSSVFSSFEFARGSQENVPQAAETVTTSNELDFLFSLMFNELLNGTTQVVSKSFVVTNANAPNQRQQQHTTPSASTTVAADTPPLNIQTTPETTSQAPTQAPTVTATENINQAETNKENAQVEEDELINIFSTPIQERGDSSSHHVDWMIMILWALEMEHYLEYMDNEVWNVIQNGKLKRSEVTKESLEKGYDRFQKLLSQLDALGAGVSDEDANHKFLRHPKDIHSSSRTYDNVTFLITKPKRSSASISQATAQEPSNDDDVDLIHEDLVIDDLDLEGQSIGLKKTAVEETFNHALWLSRVEYCGIHVTLNLSFDSYNALHAKYDEIAYEFANLNFEKDEKLEKVLMNSHTVSNASSIIFSICPSNDSDGELGAVSDVSSTHYSTCQSNDSDGELGTVSDHSVNDDPIHDNIPIPSIEQVTIVTQKTQPQVPKPQQTVDPSCAQHVKTPRQPIRTPVTPSPIPSNNRQNWNQRMERDLGTGYSFVRKPCFVCGSLSHLIKDCDYYEKKMARQAALKRKRVVHADVRQATPAWTNTNRVNKANQFTPRPVQLSNIRPNLSTASNTIKTGRVNVNTGHGNVNSGNVYVNSGTQIKSGSSRFNTGKLNVNSGSVHVNSARVTRPVSNQTSYKTSPKFSQVNLTSPKKCFSKRSPVNRPFSRNTAHQSNKYAVKGKMGTAVKTSAGCVWRKAIPLSKTNSGPTPDSNDHPLKHMEHRGIFDSGCSGHMTGNRAHLEDYQELSKEGSVTFGGSKGSISGKGTIRLGNLVFDDVAFVKELGHFNLFSISQICDKKLNVLFTEKECFVVSSDFKMPDANQQKPHLIGAPRPLLPSMLLVATNPIAGQEHAAQALSQPLPPPPPIPSPTPAPIPTSTSPPPIIPSPTPPPIPTPTSPPPPPETE
ncbi:hypothetical protein Tco_0922548, partial [Tanacetum coccineum]